MDRKVRTIFGSPLLDDGGRRVHDAHDRPRAGRTRHGGAVGCAAAGLVSTNSCEDGFRCPARRGSWRIASGAWCGPCGPRPHWEDGAGQGPTEWDPRIGGGGTDQGRWVRWVPGSGRGATGTGWGLRFGVRRFITLQTVSVQGSTWSQVRRPRFAACRSHISSLPRPASRS